MKREAGRIKEKNRNSVARGYLVLGMVTPLFALYIFFCLYYNNHFYNHTWINNFDFSNKTIEQGQETIVKEMNSYSLLVQGRNGITDTISGNSIGLRYEMNEKMDQALAEQNNFLWPIEIFKKHRIEVDSFLFFDQQLFIEEVAQLKHLEEEVNQSPKDAYISEYMGSGYEIISEDYGAKLDEDKLLSVIKESILMLDTVLLLETSNCYMVPKVYSDDLFLNETVEKMNKIVGTVITYEFGEDVEILDKEQISQWLSLDSAGNVLLNEAGIKEYVDYIGKTYNTFGRERNFKTSYGETIKIKGGDYGWWLNRSQEVIELKDLIVDGANIVRMPVYYQTASEYGKDDIGDTYVELNLTAQHLFFYYNGMLYLESDFVSGNIAKGYGTPIGTYPIQYKQKNATLVGEDYSTPVNFWMPFNGNIGLHDASWRQTFGGNIYLTSGSHGCINLPEYAASTLFEYIERGTAVVVYELEGTESYDDESIDNLVEQSENN